MYTLRTIQFSGLGINLRPYGQERSFHLVEKQPIYEATSGGRPASDRVFVPGLVAAEVWTLRLPRHALRGAASLPHPAKGYIIIIRIQE